MNLAPLIYALGWSLLHSLWQGALLAGMAYVLVSVFYLSAKEKVNLLFTFLGVLLFAFIGTFISYLPGSTAIGKTQLPVSLEGIAVSVANGNSDSLLILERYFPYMSLFYILGVCIQFTVLMVGYLGIIQLRRAEKGGVPEPWERIFTRLNETMGIRKKVGFYLSAKVEIPTVIGYFKPLILFPIAALSALDLKQVETILIHELSHIRRNDYVLNMLKCLVEAILFFNPFVRILCRMLEKEREYTCDDEVLNYGGDAMVYAYALLSLESARTKNSPSLALGAFNNKEHLLQRIKRITIMKTTTLNIRHKLSAMALLIAGALGLAWVSPANDTVPHPPKPPVLAEADRPAPPLPIIPRRPSAETLEPLPPLAPLAPTAPLAPPSKPDTLDELKVTESVVKLFSSPEWKTLQREIEANGKEIGEVVAKQFETPEWMTFQKDLSQNAAELAQLSTTELFNSPEWKAAMKDVQEQAQEMGLRAIGGHDSTYFKSNEWKQKEKEMEEKSRKLEDLSKQIEEKMNSPEVKAKREALEKRSNDLSKRAEVFQKQFETPEFKAKQEALVKKAAALARRSEAFQAKVEAEFKARSDQKKIDSEK
ncbi:hypothetical protein M1D52_00280 [Olivibacter sp. SA151]|uniref:M56 family metallopeptidase n=1 Tax=Olivibacter jilunii TaxID=985016 RepID=UPI003F14AFE4